MANKSERNPELLYGFDERPPVMAQILFAIQYMIPNIISLLLLILVIEQASIPRATATSIISITLIVMAIVTFLQSRRWPGLGSGMLLPPSAAPPYIPSCILALKTGGLPLMFGMTLLAGIFQILLSFVIRHLKKLVPEEIAALVLLLISFQFVIFSVHMYTQVHSPFTSHSKTIFYYLIMYLPFLLILTFDHLAGALLKKYGIAIAVAISYLIIYLCGFMPSSHLQAISQASWFFLPHFAIGHYQFSADLIAPFLLSATVCAVKLTGAVPALEEIQVKNWQGADFKRLSKANFVDGLGTLLAGLFGGTMGMNAGSSGIALSLGLRMTARIVAIAIACLLVAFAFIPKIGLVLLYTPHVIMAAVLLQLGSSLARSSSKILIKSLHQLNVQLYIGIGLTVGLSYNVYPEVFHTLPPMISSFIGSSIALAMLTAVILHLVFSLISKLKTRSPAPEQPQ